MKGVLHMGRNARRRHGSTVSGWFLTDEYGTTPIGTLDEFRAALAIVGGDQDDDSAATEAP